MALEWPSWDMKPALGAPYLMLMGWGLESDGEGSVLTLGTAVCARGTPSPEAGSTHQAASLRRLHLLANSPV